MTAKRLVSARDRRLIAEARRHAIRSARASVKLANKYARLIDRPSLEIGPVDKRERKA